MTAYRPPKRVETYASFLWSQITGGLASGWSSETRRVEALRELEDAGPLNGGHDREAPFLV
jgi:hypothetical protein